MREQRPAWKNSGGMTLVEVLVALAIVFVVFLGLNGAGLIVLDQNIKNSERDEAVNVAETEMEAVRNIPFANLPVADNTITYTVPPRVIRGFSKTYTVTRTIRYMDPENRGVTIGVAWTRLENKQARTYNHQQVTIVRQP